MRPELTLDLSRISERAAAADRQGAAFGELSTTCYSQSISMFQTIMGPPHPAEGEGMRRKLDSGMKSDLLNLVSPVFAAAMIALVSFFPDPQAARDSLGSTLDLPEVQQVLLRELGPDVIYRAPSPAPSTTEIARTPCFRPHGPMSVVEIDLCAEFILELTRALDDPRIAQLFEGHDLSQISPVSNPQYLRMAAVRLCRERWIRTGGNLRSLDSPICVEAAVTLDSRELNG